MGTEEYFNVFFEVGFLDILYSSIICSVLVLEDLLVVLTLRGNLRRENKKDLFSVKRINNLI